VDKSAVWFVSSPSSNVVFGGFVSLAVATGQAVAEPLGFDADFHDVAVVSESIQ
jgi:hypothetical protein